MVKAQVCRLLGKLAIFSTSQCPLGSPQHIPGALWLSFGVDLCPRELLPVATHSSGVNKSLRLSALASNQQSVYSLKAKFKHKPPK